MHIENNMDSYHHDDTNAAFSDEELQLDAFNTNPPSRPQYPSGNNTNADLQSNFSDELPAFEPNNMSSMPKQSFTNYQPEAPKQEESKGFFSNFNFGGDDQSDRASTVSPVHSYIDDEAELKEKRIMLQKIRRYEIRKGIKPENPVNIHSSLGEIKEELDAIRKECQMESTVDKMKKALVFLTWGVETMNTKYDPVDLYLDGWSASIDEDIDSYEDVLEKIYDLYYQHIDMHPVLELGLMLATSAAMHHASRSGRGMKIFQGPKPQRPLQPPSGDLAEQIIQQDLNQMQLN